MATTITISTSVALGSHVKLNIDEESQSREIWIPLQKLTIAMIGSVVLIKEDDNTLLSLIDFANVSINGSPVTNASECISQLTNIL